VSAASSERLPRCPFFCAQEDVAHSKDGSLLSTINSNIIELKGMQPKDTESVTRDLAHALARSIATISRGSSREGSPEKGRISSREASPKKVPGSPKRGGARRDANSYLIPHNLLQTSQSSLSVNESASISQHNQDLERSTLLVRSLQEQTKRRMREIDRLHADAEKDKSGPTLYNPAAFQPRGAALSTRVTNIVNGPSIRPKCAPKPALKSTETKKGYAVKRTQTKQKHVHSLTHEVCRRRCFEAGSDGFAMQTLWWFNAANLTYFDATFSTGKRDRPWQYGNTSCRCSSQIYARCHRI
jgi:hypothetical protein